MRITRHEQRDDPPKQRASDRSDGFRSERWPRTPRVIRWAWAAGITALVVAQSATGHDPETQTLIRLVHDLAELLDTRGREDLRRPDAADPPSAPEPRSSTAGP